MMMWRTLAVIGAAVIGSGAIAAEQDPAPDIQVEQIVYRNDTIVAAPSIRFVAGKTASLDTEGGSIRLKTIIRSEPSATSVAVRTTASWTEDGKEAKPETTEFVGGIGSGTTKTWQGKDGTVYRLVTNISVATNAGNAAPPPLIAAVSKMTMTRASRPDCLRHPRLVPGSTVPPILRDFALAAPWTPARGRGDGG